jgi:murein L,D-transpeptidase YcbB/YkuD
VFTDVRDDLERLYREQGWSLLWSVDGRPTAAALALTEQLLAAPSEGLQAEDYDATHLASQVNDLLWEGGSVSDDSLVRLDLALSIASARFAAALHHGRVSPSQVHVTFRLPPDSFDLAATVLALTGTSAPLQVFQQIEPHFAHYWLLKSALAQMRRLALDSTLVPLPPFPNHLRPGGPYPGAPALRRLLRALGDLPDTLDTSPDPAMDTVYRPDLSGAVARFQKRNGLTPDSAIGAATVVQLNRPFPDRIRQMELTLERWRWMPRSFSAPPVIVNIPAFRLYAFSTFRDEESQLLAMDVMVGEAYHNDTPVFAAEMTHIIFRPYWDVTPDISRSEIRPHGLSDPEWLTKNHYELVRGDEVVAATGPNLAAIGTGGAGAVRVRQTPGSWNALGGVKFMLPNEHNIYLHDTPAQSLFSRVRRDFSHGCIRLSNPFGLAWFLLRDQPDWTAERIYAAMNGTEPVAVKLSHPIPVFVMYATVMPLQSGELRFYPDIYRHDARLDRLLKKGYPYPK